MIRARPLGDLIEAAPPRRAKGAAYPVLSMTMHDGLVDQSSKFKKRVASEDTSQYLVVERGQLVVGFPVDEGVLSFQRQYPAAIVSPAYGVWSIQKEDVTDRGYLERYLRSGPALDYYGSKLRGSTARRRSLPRDLFLSMPIPLPPIEEQRRIAAVLDAADALRAKRRQALSKLDTLTQAIFIDMFGDPVVNSRGWPLADLQELGSLDRGVSKHRPRNDPKLLGGRWPLLQTGDVAASGGYIDRYESTYSDLGVAQSRLWPVGTLCITIAANIAKTGILQFDACFPDSVVGFSAVDSGTVEYVRSILNFLQPTLEKQAPESAQKNINLKVLRELRVPHPPAELRAEFARRVRLVNGDVRNMKGQLRALDAMAASLQHRAFRGEL